MNKFLNSRTRSRCFMLYFCKKIYIKSYIFILFVNNSEFLFKNLKYTYIREIKKNLR